MIADLRERCHDPELIDDPVHDGRAISRMHGELAVINRWLGGFAATTWGLERLVGSGPRELVVLDAGSGGGDTAGAIIRWARRRGRRARVIALDLNPSACADARARSDSRSDATVVAGDAFALPFGDGTVDVAHAALFLHHFREDEIVALVRELARVSRHGVVVNDLHRHWLAWASIRLLTRAFSRSRLIRHDAPLSVRRGFTRKELTRIFRTAGLAGHSVSWRWAFRYVAVANGDRREGADG